MNISDYPVKKAKVRQYSEDAIDCTIARVSSHLSGKNIKGEDSKICNVLRDILKKTTPLNQSIFIRTFNELANDYDDQDLVLHANCLTHAFLRDARHWSN